MKTEPFWRGPVREANLGVCAHCSLRRFLSSPPPINFTSINELTSLRLTLMFSSDIKIWEHFGVFLICFGYIFIGTWYYFNVNINVIQCRHRLCQGLREFSLSQKLTEQKTLTLNKQYCQKWTVNIETTTIHKSSGQFWLLILKNPESWLKPMYDLLWKSKLLISQVISKINKISSFILMTITQGHNFILKICDSITCLVFHMYFIWYPWLSIPHPLMSLITVQFKIWITHFLEQNIISVNQEIFSV